MKFLRLFTGPRDVEIEVSKSRNSVSIELPDFDRRVADGTLREMVERLFQATVVEAVFVGLAERNIVVEFDSSRAAPSEALTAMAAALLQPVCSNGFQKDMSRLLNSARGAATRLATVRDGHGLRTVRMRRERRGALDIELTAIHNRRPLAQALATEVRQLPGVRSVTCVPTQSLVRIAYDEQLSRGRLITAVTHDLATLLENPQPKALPPRLAAGATRLGYLALGGGCFVMSLLGMVVPGLPTVPFVLATSYFFVRSSPRLDRRLRDSRFFGAMLNDWDEYGGIRPQAKVVAVLFSLSLSVVMIVVMQPSLGTLALIAVGTGIGITFVLRMPTVREPAELEAPRRLRLADASQRLRLLLVGPPVGIEGTA